MKKNFIIDPNIIFLNHGSFGATPLPVLKVYQDWQIKLERQPVQFILHEMFNELEHARENLGTYLNANAEDLVFIPNVTFGINIIARSLPLNQGDEILSTDHEYGACENIWEFLAQKNGSVFVKQPIPLPLSSPEDIANSFLQGITPKTKIIFISHITSPTAVQMPVDIICEKARKEGIITIIDGSHAPGQIQLDLKALNADFYVGNCHKWMMSPKGAGFLFTRHELQALVEPLVIGWGWGKNSPYTTGSKYLDNLEWWGTKDPSAYLSVQASIKFQEDHDWYNVRNNCQQILEEGVQQINELTGMKSVYSCKSKLFVQMAIVSLPLMNNLLDFQTQLHRQFNIEIPCIQWHDQQYLRISVQGYNTHADIDALINALKILIPLHRVY